jgi:hypothetical protein
METKKIYKPLLSKKININPSIFHLKVPILLFFHVNGESPFSKNDKSSIHFPNILNNIRRHIMEKFEIRCVENELLKLTFGNSILL